MKIEKHMKNLKESTDVLEECIKRGDLVGRQRTIGFHTSAASVDLLEIFLHQKNLIDPGVQLKHDWFGSKKKLESKIPFSFPKKTEIVELMAEIENKRNILCYGVPLEKETIKESILLFQKLRKIFEELGVKHE